MLENKIDTLNDARGGVVWDPLQRDFIVNIYGERI